MKLLFLVILLLITLTGCDRTDLWGYESYSHCMLEVISKQPSVDNDVKTNAKIYCSQKFPWKSYADVIVGGDNITELNTPNVRALFIDAQGIQISKEKFDEVRLKIDPLKIFTDEEVFSYMTPQQLAFIKDAKDLTNEELWQRVKQKNNLIKEINKEMKDLRDEVDKRKSKGVWSIPTKAVEDMTDEELFE
jgi:hypothetical protein